MYIINFSFPSVSKSPDLYAKWIANMRGESLLSRPPEIFISNSSRLCSEHFEESMMYRVGTNVYIQRNAVPTKFDFPPYLQKVCVKCVRIKIPESS